MRRLLLMAVGSLAGLAAGPADAGFPIAMKATCPIGGEKFEFTSTPSYSTWGERPDGKPYGSWSFPMEMPECPSNHLVVYREDFSDAEKAQLKSLIASVDYRVMVGRETPYYRAAWLARRLTPTADDAVWLLLQAGWQSDRDAERKARYQREFIEAVDAVAPRPDDEAWRMMQARAANAQRELGLFDLAAARVDALLASEDPQWTAKVSPAARERTWAGYAEALRTVIARRDAASEPLDMVPDGVAAGRCLREGEAAQPAEVCARPDVAESMEAMRKYMKQP